MSLAGVACTFGALESASVCVQGDGLLICYCANSAVVRAWLCGAWIETQRGWWRGRHDDQIAGYFSIK